YDGRSLLTAQAVLKDAVPLFETHYDYDRAGNLTHRRDSVQGVDEYRYDAIGRLLQHTDPKGKIERFFNDPAGDRLATRVQQVQLRKVVGGDDEQQVQWTREGTYDGVHYVFDRAGDLIRKGSPHGPAPDDLELRWDPNHRLTESRKAGQVTHYGYDPLGRRVFKRNPTHTTWFYWDGDALLGEVKHANDDPDAAPIWIGNVANLIEAKRRKEKLAKLHERVREYVYYPDTFMPFALLVKSFGLIANSQWRISEGDADPVKPSSKRDGLGREKEVAVKHKGSLDNSAQKGRSLGNLGAETILGKESGKILSAKAKAEGAPLVGSLDGNFRLGSQFSGTKAATDLGDKQKIGKIPYSPSERITPIDSVHDDVFAGGEGCDELQVPESVSYCYHVDPNGCPAKLIDSSGGVVWSEIYSAWGCFDKRFAGEVENPLRFQGQYFDSETGLSYNLHRYYDGNMGGYINQDPLRLNGGINLYGYGVNPLQWIDPLGLMASLTQINADILRANMAREGRAVFPGQAAGHIVASTGASGHWAPAVDSRAILTRYRIGINDAANGIAVGHPRPHNEMHTGRFHRDVRARLQGVVQRMTQQGRGDRAIRRALRRELRSIGRGCRV
ncbi:type IV secretion protein Rhs, partial [Xanthomonas oryzae pv. oryzae]